MLSKAELNSVGTEIQSGLAAMKVCQIAFDSLDL